jgi:effector-binding domain-containing protein
MKKVLSTLFSAAIVCTFASCSGSDTKTDNAITSNNDTTSEVEVVEKAQTKGPIINIQDSTEVKQIVLCLKDSSATIEGMYQKLSNIYNVKLQETIKAGKLQILGSPMAWQTVEKDAYFFEAGIPVDKAPSKMGKGMYMKSTGEDSAVVAHFWGPLNLTKSAYDALAEKLTDAGKTKSNASYEIYKGDFFPANNAAVDFYKLQTDIVTPFKGYVAPKEKKVSLTLTAKEAKKEANESKVGKGKKIKKKKAVAAPL